MSFRASTHLFFTAALAVSTALCQEWTFNESRALGKLAGRLWSEFEYLVTYEKAPYDDRDLRKSDLLAEEEL